MASNKKTKRSRRSVSGKHLQQRTKLMPVHHTGKVRPHHHTSYGSLVIVLLLAFLPLLIVSQGVSSALVLTGGGGYQTNAVVAAPAPTTAPVISSPTIGQTYTSDDPVTVRGSCPANTLIQVFKNNVLTGASLCVGGSFAISIGLFAGSNSLTAQAFNANDVPGPMSDPVTVTLQLPGVSTSSLAALGSTGAPASQFYITSNQSYRGVQIGQPASWILTAAGGQPPYAVQVSWGDGTTDLISRPAAGPFTITHTYNQAANSDGGYAVTIKATDQASNQAYLQLLAIVAGGKQSISLIARTGAGIEDLKLAWQLLALGILVVLSFWLGERRELFVLRHRGKLA